MSSDDHNAQKEPLYNQIKSSSKWRYWIGIPLAVIGAISVFDASFLGLLMLVIGLIILLPVIKWDKIKKK